MSKPKSPVDYPAKNYFTLDELLTLIDKCKMFIRINETDRSKHYRNTDKDKEVADRLQKRIEFYSGLLDKLVELASAPNDN